MTESNDASTRATQGEGITVTAFKDGEVLGPARRTHGWGNQGGYAVAANDSFLYIGGRMNNMVLGGTTEEHSNQHWKPMGFEVAGEYLFVPYTGASRELGFSTGHVEAFRLSEGGSVGHMQPSKEIGEIGEIGLQDIRECLRAHRRSDGEYLVFLEKDYKAKVLLYRWKP